MAAPLGGAWQQESVHAPAIFILPFWASTLVLPLSGHEHLAKCSSNILEVPDCLILDVWLTKAAGQRTHGHICHDSSTCFENDWVAMFWFCGLSASS
jgi:hypothetical protein